MPSFRFLSLLPACLLMSGCVPFPSFRYYAPAVSGVITQDGAPVRSAQILVSGKFTEEVRSTSTGQDGRFSAESIRKLLLTASLMGDPLYAYEVQITVDGEQFIGYSEASVGYLPRKLALKCDLSHPIKLGSRTHYCSPVGEGG